MKPTRIILTPEHKAHELEPWVRDAHALLSGGSKLSEQMAGETRSAKFNRDSPPTMTTKLKRPPAQIVCLSAKLSSGPGPTMSGMPVHWTWGGTASVPTITINDVVGLADATDYDVSLWLSEG